MIGQTVSHYKILEKLGEGGMGIVYKAEDTKLKRTVALKFLPQELTSDPESKKRFLHEAQAAAAIEHQNICNIHEIDEAEGKIFIVMNCVEGQDLKEKIDAGPLTIDEVLKIAIQAVEGLQEAHEKGTVHRDIKSANIMINEKGQVKILDFGLAKLRGQTRLTKQGIRLGTAAYMSPEQSQGEDIDHRSDIWSFGVVLYEMISGQLPFKGEYEQAVVYSIMNEDPEPLTALRPGVPPELERIVAKALTKDPQERYQSIKDMLIDLKRFRRDTGMDSQLSFAKAARPLKRKPARSFPWNKTGIGLGIAISLMVIIYWILFRGPFKERSSPANMKDNSIAIMYFKNMVEPGDKQRLGEMITDLLITDLAESRFVSVVSRQRLYDILKLMGKEGLKRVDESVASEVAARSKSRWMLLGSILTIEPQMVITTRMVDVKSGRVEASQRVTGDIDQDVFSLVDRLAVEIRKDLSLPAAAAQEPDRPVADVTTHSQEAYRYYLEGYDYYNKGYGTEAEKSFRKAIELDPTFAMAYYMLSMSLDNRWMFQSKEEKIIIEKAIKYSDKVSLKEKYYINSQAAKLSGKYSQAIKILEKLLERYPDDKEAYAQIGYIYFYNQQMMEKAIHYFNKVIEIDPLYKLGYNHLALAYDRIGDPEKSIRAINKYIGLAPQEAVPYETRGTIYASHGRIDQAIESLKKASEIKPGFADLQLGHMYLLKREYDKAGSYYRKLASASNKYNRSLGRVGLALIPYHQGKLQETLKVLENGMAADKMEQFDYYGNAGKYLLKAFVYMELNELILALKECETAIEIRSRDLTRDKLGWEGYHAFFLGANNQFERVEEIAGILKKEMNKKDRTLRRSYWRLLGWCELSRGNLEAAISHLEKSIKEKVTFLDYYLLAKANLDTGRLGEAVDKFEKAISIYEEKRAFHGIYGAKVYYLLGLAYEKSGWNRKAIEKYEEFLDIWKDADPGIKEIKIAKQRLAKLKGMID
jgi:serine/threonine protein kinase/Tfp pilus assembly protein PilF